MYDSIKAQNLIKFFEDNSLQLENAIKNICKEEPVYKYEDFDKWYDDLPDNFLGLYSLPELLDMAFSSARKTTVKGDKYHVFDD